LGTLADVDVKQLEEHLDRCGVCAARYRQTAESQETPGSTGPVASSERPEFDETTWVHQSGRDRDQTAFARLLDPPSVPGELGRIGDFRVLRVLGAGGMGVVFEAEDCRLKRRVAIKLMRPTISAEEGAIDRFLREAQSAAALKHEHIVTIYQVGTHRDLPFLALELLEGESLRSYLSRRQSLDAGTVMRISREIAAGLAAAHSRGLLHRDIKPANIWLERREKWPGTSNEEIGRVKILDFGLAKPWQEQTGLTQSGVLIGTPGYMAPEHLTGTLAGPPSDLFSLGCVMFEMATGRLAFQGKDLLSTLRALAVEDTPAVRTLNPHISEGLSRLIGELLSRVLDQRPSTAQAVVERLDAMERESAAPTERWSTAALADVKSVSAAPAAPPAAASGSTGSRHRLGRKTVVGGSIGAIASVALVFVLLAPKPGPSPKGGTGETPIGPNWIPSNWQPLAGAVLDNPENGLSEPDIQRRRFWRALTFAMEPRLERPLVLRLVASETAGPGRNPPASFYILETKIWNGLYKAFADDRPKESGNAWQEGTWKSSPAADRGLLPVTNISAKEAGLFCQWCQAKFFGSPHSGPTVVRLPNKEEWDRAAAYDAWAVHDPRVAGFDGPEREPLTIAGKAFPVGSGSGSPLWHVEDLAGDGLEWTDSFAAGNNRLSDLLGRDALKDLPFEEIELRGQSWMGSGLLTYQDPPESIWKAGKLRPFDERGPDIGFRFVVEIPSTNRAD
jgi:serine/threonine protein kinase